MFPATLPLAATGTGPLPGPGPGAGLAERGFTLGNADAEGLERHLRSLRARNHGEDDKEGEDGEDEEGEDKGSEMVLDAAGRATVAQLAGLSEAVGEAVQLDMSHQYVPYPVWLVRMR